MKSFGRGHGGVDLTGGKPGGMLNRREFLKIGGVGVVGAALLGSGALSACGRQTASGGEEAGNGAAEQQFRYGATQPPDYSSTEEAQAFADLLEERSEGRLSVRVFPGGQLGEGAELIEGAQSGQIAFTKATSSQLSEFVEDLGVFDLPYLFDDKDHFFRYLETDNALGMLDQLEDIGLVGLAYHDSDARNFYTTERVIETPEELEGLRIRVQPSRFASAFMESLGASAEALDFGEVYSALQTGVVDGAENNWPSYYNSSHYEVAPNYTVDQHTRIPLITLVSKELFDGLDEEDQELVRRAARDAARDEQPNWEQEVEDARESVMEEGEVTVVEVDDLAPWQEATEPVREQFRDNYGETLDAIEEAAS